MSKSAWLLALSLPALYAPAQDPEPAQTPHAALLDHYARVERELRAAPPPKDPERAAVRLQTLDLLREYRKRGRFGIDHDPSGERRPLFVDRSGRRCAVAYLLDRSGHGDLTREIASTANLAWVVDLSMNPALGAWLESRGLTLLEAARIQGPPEPYYPPPPKPPPPVYHGPGDTATPQLPPRVPGQVPGPGGASRPAATASPARRTSVARTPSLPTVDLTSESWLPWFELQSSRWFAPRALPPLEGSTVSNAGGARAIEICRGALNDADPAVRAAAALSLGKLGVAGSDVRALLQDQVYEVRCAAVVALAYAGTPAAVHTLLPIALLDQDPTLRPLALAVLGGTRHQDRASARAAAGLLASSHDPLLLAGAAAHTRLAAMPDALVPVAGRVRAQGQVSLRAIVATSVGASEDAPAVAALTQAAGGPALDLRRAAASALGRTQAPLALPALLTAFELEHDLGTRAQLLLAIGEHGGDAAQAFLREQMQSGRKALRAWAAVALGIWGRGRVDPLLAAAVRDVRTRECNQDAEGLWLLAMGLLRDVASERDIAEVVRGDGAALTRTAAVYALGLVESPRRLELLRASLRSDPCPRVRAVAANVLAATCGAAATPILLETARSSAVAELRAEAAFALGATGDPDASNALVELATSAANPASLRGAALRGLGRLHAADPTLRFARLGWRDGGTLPELFTYLARLDR